MPIRWPRGIDSAKLVFSSPPYLEVMKYGKYNWIRLWLLGEDPREVDRSLMSTSSEEKYYVFMRRALVNIRSRLRDDGYVCLVLGDVDRNGRSINLADKVGRECLAETDLRVVTLLTDSIPTRHKVSRIWKDGRGNATKTDRILVLAGPDAPAPGQLERIEWRVA
jgi:site-specific DNA-methyltransferase (adenine-specific)